MRGSRPSSTAQNIALARSHLTWMGILDDPFAEAMLCPRWALEDKAVRRGNRGQNWAFAYVAARTRFYDDVVTRAVDDGIGQVVVIGAGYDSCAWRLSCSGVRFFEVDHPATQADKRDRRRTDLRPRRPHGEPAALGPACARFRPRLPPTAAWR